MRTGVFAVPVGVDEDRIGDGKGEVGHRFPGGIFDAISVSDADDVGVVAWGGDLEGEICLQCGVGSHGELLFGYLNAVQVNNSSAGFDPIGTRDVKYHIDCAVIVWLCDSTHRDAAVYCRGSKNSVTDRHVSGAH